MARTRVKPAESTVWQRFRERISLPGIEAWSTTVRTLFLNALFLIAVVIVVPILIGQFRRDQVIIEAINVPSVLSDQGLTPEVVASRIWDGLGDVKAAAKTSKESLVAIPDARQVEFSFPDSGFSIESLVFHVRKLFNAYETRVAGEFVCGDDKCERSGLKLRLRVIRDDVKLVDLPEIGARDERGYFRDAAAGVMSELDPFTALASLTDTQPLRATILARRLIRQHHKDAKWAHNLIGTIRVYQGDYMAAIEEFRAALSLDPEFRQSMANLGNALVQSGDRLGGKAEFERLKAIDPKNVLAAEGMANLAVDEGNPAEAVRLLVEASEWDPLSPRYFAKAGKIELDAGHVTEGEALLKQSLEIDPGYPPAFAFLAAQHLAKGDYESAEKIYRDAADYAPDDANAQMEHGRILAVLKRCGDAIPRFERAVTIAPTVSDYRRQLAQCQQETGKPDLALATASVAIDLDPTAADLVLIQANSLRDLGRKAEAIAAYRKFLDLDKENSPMRPIAERFIEILSSGG